MRERAFPCILRLLLWIYCLAALIFAAPQAPTLDLSVYKLSVDFDNGVAVRREVGIDLPFFKVKNTAEFQLGNKGATDDDSDESEEMEKRRRKRAISSNNESRNEIHKREKREPCYGYGYPMRPSGGNYGTGGGGTDNIPEEARRLKRKVSRIAKSKKSKIGRRRRREVQNVNSEQDFANGGNKMGQSFDKFMQKVNNLWQGVVQSTEQLVREVKQAVNSFKTSTSGNPPNSQPPSDAELI